MATDYSIRLSASRFSLLFICAFLYSLSGSGQLIQEQDGLWLDGGAGVYLSLQESRGFVWSLGGSMQKNEVLYSGRFTRFEEYLLFGPRPVERFSSFGLMIGKGFSGRIAHLYFSAGLGATGGVKRGELDYISYYSSRSLFGLTTKYYKEDRFVTPSIPIEIDFMLKFGKHFGPGLTLFADLNMKQPMFGATVDVKIGKIGPDDAGIGVAP